MLCVRGIAGKRLLIIRRIAYANSVIGYRNATVHAISLRNFMSNFYLVEEYNKNNRQVDQSEQSCRTPSPWQVSITDVQGVRSLNGYQATIPREWIGERIFRKPQI